MRFFGRRRVVDNRALQVHYFIGLAYESIGKKKDAINYYTLTTQVEAPNKRARTRSGFMSYYQGLSYLRLKNKAKVEEIFYELADTGNARLDFSAKDQADYFQIFGQREDENTQASMSHTIRGLGYKGLARKSRQRKTRKRPLIYQLVIYGQAKS